MTSKSEMVSVPRVLLERWKSNMQGMGLQEMPAQIDAILDAPAEDARVVVDEPVAFMSEICVERIKRQPYRNFVVKGERGPEYEVPLYLRPQRPIVMPDRDA